MNRYHRHPAVCLILTFLVGLILTCGLGPPDAGDEISPATATATSALQQVQSTSRKPAGFGGFGGGNLLSVHFPGQPAQPGVVHAASDPALPRDFTLPTPLFAPGSAWNQTATGAAILPDSDQQILVTYRVLLGDDSSLSSGTETPNWPFMDVNYSDYAIPVFRMGTGQQTVWICDYDGILGWTNPKLPISQAGGPVTVPAPAATVRPAQPQDTGADGHLVLYNPGSFEEYDFWQATTIRDGLCQSRGGGLTGTTIFEAGAIDFFDVRESGANPDTYSSARATGVPLLAGLILPEDVESGAISHALAFAIPGPRNTNVSDPYNPFPSDYFYPVSTTETDFYNTDPDALAAGQRIRLKQEIVYDTCNSIDENSLALITRMFLTALRTHGAYLVDNAGGFTFYAEDIYTAVLDRSDDQVNELIDQPQGTPLPAGKTKWQIVIEKLNEDLEQIPIACGPESQDPSKAEVTTSNFEVVEPATSNYLTAAPSSRAIDPGGVAAYTIGVGASSGFTISLVASSPSPSLTLQLVPTSVIPPGQATLTVTDSHTGPTLLPGLWYTVPITATDGVTQTTSVSLLVGGARLYLPLIMKSY